MNRVELEQAQISLDEASLLFQQGFLTEIELSQTTLSAKAAEIRAFSAAYDLYQILGELLFLYRGIR
jgi:outer membrane protein TolC